MIVHPAIAGLRSRPAPQPRLDAALARWRGSHSARTMHAGLAAYGEGAPLDAVPDLARLLRDCAAASALAHDFIAPVMAALTTEPLAQLPLGHSAAPGIVRIRLADSGRASLALAAYAQAAQRQPASVLFEDGEAHEIVIAGAGQALCHRLSDRGLESRAITCLPGTRLARGGASEARQFVAVARPLLVLQLVREAVSPAPSREVSLPDGVLLQTISGSKHASQMMIALGVLGALEHRPALEPMERLARDQQAERDLRWEALRQVLGLDTVCGMALLGQLAARGEDPLAPPAAQLRRNLLAAQPELAKLEHA
ncbi:MAG: hypothetical protein ACK4IC_08300 [Erythrobacter sp.]